MEDEKWKTQYEQLNQRARWYSAQLWVVPFTYLGLIGVGFEKINALKDTYLRSTGLLLTAFLSLTVFVHVSAVKYYERKAIKAMRDLENPKLSSGGSPWYLSYVFFIKAILCALTFAFTVGGIWPMTDDRDGRLGLLILSAVVLAILYLLIIINDHSRNKTLLQQIKEPPE